MKNHSKGFFFTLISFILVLYIYVYLTAWINAGEIQERASSERFRATDVEAIAAQLTQEKFQDFFNISGYYALYRINDFASYDNQTMKNDSSDGMRYLSKAFFGCLLSGQSNDTFDSRTGLAYNQSEKGTYTLAAWVNNLNRTLAPAGMNITIFNVSNAKFEQVDPVTFNGSMDISLYIEDNLHTISINRSFTLTQQFNISGLPDPMIARETRPLLTNNAPAERQIYFRNVSIDELKPRKWNQAATQGQGFFYGYLVNASQAHLIWPTSDTAYPLKSQYILVGTYDQIHMVSPTGEDFGGYIITTNPGNTTYDNCHEQSETDTFNAITYRGPNCNAKVEDVTSRPYLVLPHFSNLSWFYSHHFDINPPYPDSDSRALLIANSSVEQVKTATLSKNRGGSLYEIERLRDLAVCTWFIPSDRAPSYPQRLTNAALYSNSSEFGMETFLVGSWAGGADLPSYKQYSRVDIEFFKQLDGTKIRGMPTCKNFNMCNLTTGPDAPLGHFSLTDASEQLYGADIIACDDYRSDCGDNR